VGATDSDELWPQVAARINSARGWSLRPLARLGLPRAARRTWLAEAAGTDVPGTVVVKASANPFAASRAGWVASALSLLGDRGYPVPTLLWQGPLDGHWFLTVQERLPGEPVRTLDRPSLDALLALVELQAAPPIWPACFSIGTGCDWRARGRWRPTAMRGWPVASSRSPATRACGWSSPTARSPAWASPPSATSWPPSKPGAAPPTTCSTHWDNPAAEDR
jgi:hypothetical protein